MPSLHVQMLIVLSARITERQHELERKVGRGLEDRDYQRHVGRIAECEHLFAMVEELKKTDLDEIEDLEEETKQRDSQERRAKRRARSD